MTAQLDRTIGRQSQQPKRKRKHDFSGLIIFLLVGGIPAGFALRRGKVIAAATFLLGAFLLVVFTSPPS